MERVAELVRDQRGQVDQVGADDSAAQAQAASVLEASGAPSAARLLDSAGGVQSVSLSQDRALLAVAGADGSLRLWHVASPDRPAPAGRPLVGKNDSPLYTTAFSPDGRLLAAAGAGQPLTPGEWASYVPGVAYHRPCGP